MHDVPLLLFTEVRIKLVSHSSVLFFLKNMCVKFVFVFVYMDLLLKKSTKTEQGT